MLQITTDVAALSTPQRELLAGFILAFGNIERRDPAVDKAVAEFERQVTTGEVIPFNLDFDPATAFGSANSPLLSFPPAGLTLVAPVAPPPPPPPALSPELTQVGVDKSGAIWDAALHSSSKAFTADGMWRKKRGAAGEPSAPATQVAPTAPPPPARTTQVIAPPPPGVDLRGAYVQLVGKASRVISENKLTHEEFDAAARRAGVVPPDGVPALQALGSHLDLVAAVVADIDAILASRA